MSQNCHKCSTLTLTKKTDSIENRFLPIGALREQRKQQRSILPDLSQALVLIPRREPCADRRKAILLHFLVSWSSPLRLPYIVLCWATTLWRGTTRYTFTTIHASIL